MTSVAQIAANRSNAQKSTGPRTPEGKAAVAENAVKHGLFAQRAIIQGKDPGEFEFYRERMLGDLAPAGPVETVLAERIVNLSWRLGRAERFESAAFATMEAQQVAQATAQPAEGETRAEEESVLGRMIVQDFGAARVLDRLLGYERRIENSLYRTMAELRRQRSSEDRLQAGQESDLPLCAGLDKVSSRAGATATKENRAAGETKPISADASLVAGEESVGQAPPYQEEVGRGRPCYEETPHGVTTKPLVDPSCATKLTGASRAKWEALRKREIHAARADGVTTNEVIAGPFCETKPIGAGHGDERVWGSMFCETKPNGGTA